MTVILILGSLTAASMGMAALEFLRPQKQTTLAVASRFAACWIAALVCIGAMSLVFH